MRGVNGALDERWKKAWEEIRGERGGYEEEGERRKEGEEDQKKLRNGIATTDGKRGRRHKL